MGIRILVEVGIVSRKREVVLIIMGYGQGKE